MSTVIRTTIQRLKYVLYQRGVPPQDVEDIIQEAYQRLENYQQSREVAHVDGFLVRTAVNIATDRARQRKSQRLSNEPVETFIIADDAPRPDEVYASRRRLERLSEGFAKLDPVTRQIIRAQRIEGMSVASIAERHQMTGSAIEKRLAKGLKFLVGLDGRLVMRGRVIFPFARDERLRTEASQWVLRTQSGTTADLDGLDAWLSNETERVTAYVESAWVWNELATVARDEVREPDGVVASAPINRRHMLSAAAAAGVVALASPWLLHSDRISYRTAVGEQRVVTLDDGSRLTLNTNSIVSVRFSEKERALTLEQGEALFDVAHDADRPFVVAAGAQSVKAIGTSFVIRREVSRVEVTLLSGRIEVTEARDGVSRVVELAPGQRLRSGEMAPGSGIDTPQVEAIIAWCNGQLMFDESPLAEAVAEMNRYQVKPILLSVNGAPGRLSGVFRTGEGRNFARTIAALYGFRLEDRDNAIVLRGTIHPGQQTSKTIP